MLDRRWLRQFGERSANQRDIAQAALTAKINATQKKIRMALGPVVLIIATNAFSNHTFDIGVVSIGGADLASVLNRKCGKVAIWNFANSTSRAVANYCCSIWSASQKRRIRSCGLRRSSVSSA
jgi:hypothetical protein